MRVLRNLADARDVCGRMNDALTSLWPRSTAAALEQQRQLRGRVMMDSVFHDVTDIQTIAGVDVGHDAAGDSHAAIVVLRARDLQPLEECRVSLPTAFPYVPGLLSFREIPVICKALAGLRTVPDLLMVDGQGVAHPRGLGVASHLGVITGLPSVGVAKSRLFGRYTEPGPDKGEHTPLTHGAEQIGFVLRSKRKCLPLFVSAGHKINQAQSLAVVMLCLTSYRLPEPTRLADRLSRATTRNIQEKNQAALFS